MKMKGETLKQGDWMTIVGTTGKVYKGALPLQDANIKGTCFETIMQWSDKYRVLKANH